MSLMGQSRHFVRRSAASGHPTNGHRQTAPTCLKRANTGSRGHHSITSSARTSSDDGTVNPSAFGGLEVNCQLVLCRCLRWQIGKFLAF
jgi:hypothetical protein